MKQALFHLLALGAVFLFGPSARGQSYYSIQFQSPTNQRVYNCFLNLAPDGSAHFRMIYTMGGKEQLAEWSLGDSIASGKEAAHFLVAQGLPQFLRGEEDDSLWAPTIQFETRQQGDSSYDEPTGVLLKREEAVVAVPIQSLQQWRFDELVNNKALVQPFYALTDPFYVLLSGFATRGLNGDEKKRKFYLIIVANTNDPAIGKSAQTDLNEVYATFSSLTKTAGIGFVPVVVSGDNFNLGSTRKAIDTLQPGPLDILFFFYSGHGFRYDTDKSPYPRISFRTNNLQIRAENNLAIEDIYNTLLAKKAKVTIVLSDCCNEKLRATVPYGFPVLRPRSVGTEGLKFNHDNFRKLFLPTENTAAIIGTASASQLALGNPSMGGYFTHFFKAELLKSLYGNTGDDKWLKLVVNAAANTNKQSLTALCPETPNVGGRCLQKAVFDFKPR